MRKQISFSTRREVRDALREARTSKGLSQRELGERVGLPQSHVSKIEQGGVDLQLSSLSELARALDLELKLVPRQALPAVEGVIASLAPPPAGQSTRAAHSLIRSLEGLAEQIPDRSDYLDEKGAFRRTLQELRAISFDGASLRALRGLAGRAPSIEALIQDDPVKVGAAVHRLTNALRDLRNARAHGAPAPAQLPAHSLEEDEDD